MAIKRAMYGTRRASRLFLEHMKGDLKEAGYAALQGGREATELSGKQGPVSARYRHRYFRVQSNLPHSVLRAKVE